MRSDHITAQVFELEVQWFFLLLFCSVSTLLLLQRFDLWKKVKIFIQHRQGGRYHLYEELFDELLVLSAFPIH